MTLRLILLPPHASHPGCCPQCMHAYATNCARIFSLLRVCLDTPALRSLPPLLLCPTCSAHAAYTLSKLITDSSSRWLQGRPAKEMQYLRLCSALRDAGWVLAQPPAADPDMPVAAALRSAYRYSVIMLGHTGTVFEPFTRYLKPFRLPAQDVRTLMHDLHDHAVQTAHAIVTLRRRLEPSACNNNCTPPDPLDFSF